jgi:hypothetical protein
MPGGFTIDTKGFDDVIKNLDTSKFERDISDELEVFGRNVERDAKDNLAINGTWNLGFLAGSIYVIPGRLKVEIGASKDYAAYIEFGTRKFAAAYVNTLPPDWKSFAAKFKGSGSGTFAQLVENIKLWAEQTGKIPPEAAYAKARKIMIEGIPAQPYLYPAYEKNRVELIKRLKALANA